MLTVDDTKLGRMSTSYFRIAIAVVDCEVSDGLIFVSAYRTGETGRKVSLEFEFKWKSISTCLQFNLLNI
jgi:hypothetical protein